METFNSLWMDGNDQFGSAISLNLKDSFECLLHQLDRSKEYLVCDLRNKRVLHRRENEVGCLTENDGICVALAVLSNAKNYSVDVEEFVSLVFGSQRYEPLKHDNKISKFVLKFNAEMKNIAKVFRKGGKVRLEIARNVSVSRISNHVLSLLICRGSLIDSLNFGKKSNLTQDQDSKIITRVELMKIFGVSGSTAKRRLTHMVSQGHLRPQGRGKNTSYVISNDRFLQLMHNEKI